MYSELVILNNLNDSMSNEYGYFHDELLMWFLFSGKYYRRKTNNPLMAKI